MDTFHVRGELAHLGYGEDAVSEQIGTEVAALADGQLAPALLPKKVMDLKGDLLVQLWLVPEDCGEKFERVMIAPGLLKKGLDTCASRET